MLPPPAGSAVYQLTEQGQALEPTIVAIGRWGARYLGQPRPTDNLLARPYFVAIRAAFRADRAAGLTLSYEIRVGNLVFEVSIDDGRCQTREGSAAAPDAVLTMEVTTLNALLLAGLSVRSALADGLVQVAVAPAHLDRFVQLFAIRG
jgi:alkyl sulfatase BDS1-like metallo-beta-lactamase superfamily hydrolase